MSANGTPNTPPSVIPVGNAQFNLVADEVVIVESALTHVTHSPDYAQAGDIVVCGAITGVAMNTATAATDLVTVKVRGNFYLPVVASNGGGTSAGTVGNQLYLNTTTCVLSKIASGVPFGKLLCALDASASSAPACVNVDVGYSITTESAGQQFSANGPVFAAATIAMTQFVAPFACTLQSAVGRWSTKAGQAGTMQLEVCRAGEAAGAGNVMLATAFDLTGNNDTSISKAAVTTAYATLAAGDVIRGKLASGAATSLADAQITMIFAAA